jgi:hypothetical protein
MLGSMYKTTGRNIPEEMNLEQRHCEILWPVTAHMYGMEGHA